jgi:hypothetical protein
MSYSNEKSKEPRSPLTNLHVPRQAGQSLDEEIRELLGGEIMPYLAMAVVAVVLAAAEWWRWYLKAPPQPIAYTIVAAVAIAFSWWKISASIRRIRRLRLGRDGERAVAELLEGMRAQGYKVLHDLMGEGFNVDHLLTGPQGVFSIETKTRNLPAKGRGDIDYDGERVLAGGFEPDRDPIIQAKAQAHWVKGLVKEFTGKAIEVRPVVVFPGWFVNQTWKGARPDVWVVNPKALNGFIDNNNAKLSAEDVQSIHAHLSRFVSNSASK